LPSELSFSEFQISESQIFRKKKTGTNHSKTHTAVAPADRNEDVEPGGAAQSISFTDIIRHSYLIPFFIFIIKVFHPLPYIAHHIIQPFRCHPIGITTYQYQ